MGDPPVLERFRRAENPVATVTSRHTGADFERGLVHRRNERPIVGGMRADGWDDERDDEQARAPVGRQQHSPQRAPRDLPSTQASPALSARSELDAGSPREARAEARTARSEAEDALCAVLRKPWRGQAAGCKPAQLAVLSQFEERGIREKKMDDGMMIVSRYLGSGLPVRGQRLLTGQCWTAV